MWGVSVEPEIPLPTIPTEPPTAAAAGEPPAPAPAPEAPPPAQRKPRKVESAAEVAAKAIAEAAERLAVAPPAAVPAVVPTPPPPTEDEEAVYRLEALAILQRHPKYRNRDLQEEYRSYMKQVDKYEETWLKERPNEKFDIDDGSHDAWCEKNQPDIPEEEIQTAESQVGVLRLIEDRKTVELEQTLGRQIGLQAVDAAKQAVADMLTINGKAYQSFDELEAEDPVAAIILESVLPQAASMATAAVALLTPGSPGRFDQSNPMHRELHRQVTHYESEILKLPAEQRTDGNGRHYVPLIQYEKLKPRERQNSWTFRYSPDEMRALILNDIRIQTANKIESKRSRFAAKTAEPTPPPAPLRKPPSGGSGPSVIPGASAPPVPAQTSSAFWGTN